ncbi:MAG: RHS repeat protein [Verrucomicrobia bacterium]|nr:RHS repeat protein [Verrucomicrobiota bacterium]MCF7708032.1 RHS repeat protein [Verrucomicrobiota bacterium]
MQVLKNEKGSGINSANQRTKMTLANGQYWEYEYDDLGQLVSSKKYWTDGTPVAGQKFEYTHDDIGNREQIKRGGDAEGGSLCTSTYNANLLNQYTSRTVSGVVDIIGIASGEDTVIVKK